MTGTDITDRTAMQKAGSIPVLKKFVTVNLVKLGGKCDRVCNKIVYYFCQERYCTGIKVLAWHAVLYDSVLSTPSSL